MLDAFCTEFQDKVGKNNGRWNSFRFIAEKLLTLDRPVNILETGCVRLENNWTGDGQSTVMWGWIAEKTGGSVTTIDISEESVNTAIRLVPNAHVILGDSITSLRMLSGIDKIDFLYLDSFDVTGDYEAPLHHIGELASVYARLPSGCLIAVDDCSGQYGKDKYVAMFFNSIGVRPVSSGHITIWEKP